MHKYLDPADNTYFVARAYDLFDNDAVCKHQDFGNRGEQHASSFHHASLVTKHRAAPITLTLLQTGHIRQLSYGSACRRETEECKRSALTSVDAVTRYCC